MQRSLAAHGIDRTAGGDRDLTPSDAVFDDFDFDTSDCTTVKSVVEEFICANNH